MYQNKQSCKAGAWVALHGSHKVRKVALLLSSAACWMLRCSALRDRLLHEHDGVQLLFKPAAPTCPAVRLPPQAGNDPDS